MNDRRLTPSNGRVAHVSLKGLVEAERFVEGTVGRITDTVADMVSEPGGNRVRQLVCGEAFRVLDRQDGWAFGQSVQDGYVGWTTAGLDHEARPTHRVSAPRAFALEYPDVTRKGAHRSLSFGSGVTCWPAPDNALQATWEAQGWTRITGEGRGIPGLFIRSSQITAIGSFASDPASVAELFLHTPYLWGGDTGFGIDCSGLVQRCLWECGLDCPRDSDMQESAFRPIGRKDRARGDLVFWEGHVGMLLDPDTLIHANAHHMAVAIEPLDQAITRIGQKEFGEVTSYRRA